MPSSLSTALFIFAAILTTITAVGAVVVAGVALALEVYLAGSSNRGLG
jgi:hypothetical protein